MVTGKVAHGPVDGPISRHIWLAQIGLRGLLIVIILKEHTKLGERQVGGFSGMSWGRYWEVDMLKIHCTHEYEIFKE